VIAVDRLEDYEVQLVHRCLQAAASGRFFPDWEFETLFGLSRVEVRAVAERWPQNAAERTTEVAVLNAIANLYGYPHGREDEVREVLGAEPASLGRLLDKLRPISNES
jgi:hypothetical protein